MGQQVRVYSRRLLRIGGLRVRSLVPTVRACMIAASCQRLADGHSTQERACFVLLMQLPLPRHGNE